MDKFNQRSGALGPTTSFPFAMATEKFDGSKPFAVLEVWDPYHDEGMVITCKTPEDFMANWTRCSNIARGEQHTWGGKYLFHATGGPAATFYDGSTAWFKNGLVHNTTGPALEFKGGGIYCLNGQIIDPSYFDLYIEYMERIAHMRHPENRIPTFPSKYEIKDAVENELTLYFDYQTNHYWYDKNGLLHHPTGPAFEGADGVVQYWNHGQKLSEVLEPNFRADEMLEAVRQALDAAKPPYKYHAAEDVLKSPEINELEPIFKEAGRRLLSGETLDDVCHWFSMVYGSDDFEVDFSLEFKESFRERLEEILEKIDDTPNIFKRVQPKVNLIKKIDTDYGQLDKEIDLIKENVDLQNKVKKMVERANEILGHIKTEESVAQKAMPPEPVKYSEFDSIKSEEVSTDQASETKEDSGLNWGAPLGALAVAGIVGLLGAKRDVAKTVEQSEVALAR